MSQVALDVFRCHHTAITVFRLCLVAGIVIHAAGYGEILGGEFVVQSVGKVGECGEAFECRLAIISLGKCLAVASLVVEVLYLLELHGKHVRDIYPMR